MAVRTDWWDRPRSIEEIERQASLDAAWRALKRIIHFAHEVIEYEHAPTGALTRLGLAKAQQSMFEAAGLPQDLLVGSKVAGKLANALNDPAQRAAMKAMKFAAAYGAGARKLKELGARAFNGIDRTTAPKLIPAGIQPMGLEQGTLRAVSMIHDEIQFEVVKPRGSGKEGDGGDQG